MKNTHPKSNGRRVRYASDSQSLPRNAGNKYGQLKYASIGPAINMKITPSENRIKKSIQSCESNLFVIRTCFTRIRK
jgi:hypothetical protein